MNTHDRLHPCSALATFVLLAVSAVPVGAQLGPAAGLSGVRGQRFANENLLFFRPAAHDQFARALATGDFNGDGADDLATGLPLDDGLVGFEVPDCGAVAVRYGIPGRGLAGGTATTFLGQFLPGSPNPAGAGDTFGFALASCDFDGDGFDDLAVGVPGEGGASHPGAVQVYSGSVAGLGAGGVMIDQSMPGVPGDAEPFDYFGTSLACGDLDGDGYGDLAIGIPLEDIEEENAVNAGAVALIFGSPGGLDLSTSVSLYEQPPPGIGGTPEANDLFGWSLAVGDLDGDLVDDLAIGVPGEDGPAFGQGRGAVYVIFGGPTATFPDFWWLLQEDDLAGFPEDGDQLGYSLATGDLDGDGFDDLVIGVPFEDVNGVVDGGQVIVAYGRCCFPHFTRFSTWSETVAMGPGATEAGDTFGYALAAGDFDHDGFEDLAIGQPGEFLAVPGDGVLTILTGSATGLTNARRNSLAMGYNGTPGVPNQAGRAFSYSMAGGDFDGDGHADLAVGAPFEDENGLADVGAEIVLYGSLFSDGFESGDLSVWTPPTL